MMSEMLSSYTLVLVLLIFPILPSSSDVVLSKIPRSVVGIKLVESFYIYYNLSNLC